jgi:hypothetical protein
MNRFLWWGPLVALFAVAGYVSAGESTDVKELLERMKKMESKMAEQERTIKDLRAGNETKVSASQQVDKALANSSAGVIYHDAQLHKRPIKIGGYLDVSYQYAMNQPTTPMPQYNVERVFDDMDNNDFNLHLAKIFFDGTAQEKGQAGFRIDLAFGSDADRIASYGEGTIPGIASNFPLTDPKLANDLGLGLLPPIDAGSWIPNPGYDNFTIEQAYIDYIIPVGNGLRMKVGKFVTPIGFEVIEAQDNWNATRSFNFGHGIPRTHTGIGFEYQVYSNWYVAGYFVNGWDNMIDNNEGKSGIVQSKWSPTDWMTWTVSGMVGNEESSMILPDAGGTNLNQDRSGEDTTYLINTVLTFKPWEKWDFALEGTYGLVENQSRNDAADGTAGSPPAWFGDYFSFDHLKRSDAEWWGGAAYMKYKFLPDWYLAVRGEYFNDSGATRTVYGRRFFGKQELYSGTVTMSYSPTAPFEIRAEYRHDASSRDVFISKEFDFLDVHPVDFNSRDRVNTQNTLTVQFLYKF